MPCLPTPRCARTSAPSPKHAQPRPRSMSCAAPFAHPARAGHASEPPRAARACPPAACFRSRQQQGTAVAPNRRRSATAEAHAHHAHVPVARRERRRRPRAPAAPPPPLLSGQCRGILRRRLTRVARSCPLHGPRGADHAQADKLTLTAESRCRASSRARQSADSAIRG